MSDQPSYVWALVLIGVIGIPAVTSWALFQGAVDAGMGRRTARLVGGAAAYLFAAWIVASAILAGTGVYRGEPGEVAPWFGVADPRAAGHADPADDRERLPGRGRVVPDRDGSRRPALGVRVAGGARRHCGGDHGPVVARKLSRGQGHRDAVRFHWYGIADLVLALTIGFFAGLGPWLLIDIV